MMNTGQSQSHDYSKVLILSACMLLLLSFGYRSGFGLFVKPISAANGWGREVISVALLYGIVFLGHQIGSFIGVWLGGWLYDSSGRYDAVWWLGAAPGIMGGNLHK